MRAYRPPLVHAELAWVCAGLLLVQVELPLCRPAARTARVGTGHNPGIGDPWVN